MDTKSECLRTSQRRREMKGGKYQGLLSLLHSNFCSVIKHNTYTHAGIPGLNI